MTTTHRWRLIRAVLSLAATGFGPIDHPTLAGWPIHKQQVVYVTPVTQAPAAYTAQAPVLYTAQAPVAYAAQAPVLYAAQAPVAYAAQAPVAYAAQAPVAYTAQAPATYVGATAAAPTAATAAAPSAGNAPTDQGVRISLTVRNALFPDLVAFYLSADSGDTRAEKIRAVRDRAREEFEALLEGEDNPELNSMERQDLNTLVDLVISGGGSTNQRTYYPPLAPPGPVANAPGSPYGGYPAATGQPILYVPVKLRPVHTPHYYKHLLRP
jgi:hypothetical protein